MIDKWILQDIEQMINKRKRLVIIDPDFQFQFLFPTIQGAGYHIIKTDPELTAHWETVKEELYIRHETESKFSDVPVILYATRPQDKLSFLFDYCFTHGHIDLSHAEEWLKKKLFIHTGLQVQFSKQKLLTNAKMSIGKDINWWKKIIQELEEPITLEEKLLPFLHAPERTLSAMDPDVKQVFEERIFDFIGQPYSQKSPEVLAKETVHILFHKLLYNDIHEKELGYYRKWIDSNTYGSSLEFYIEAFEIPSEINLWDVHPEHCFEKVDLLILKKLCQNIHDKSYIHQKLQYVETRLKKKAKNRFVPDWWSAIITLLKFDLSPLNSCNSLQQVSKFYTEQFHKVDRSIRNLYMYFLQEETIIRPLQEYYETLNHALLVHWFEYASSYQSNQQGYLVDLFKKAGPGTAVIVGDGVRYEISAFIASKLKASKDIEINQDILFADLPSETEHNMSALYVGEGQVLPIHKDREKLLREKSEKEIHFMNLESLSKKDQYEYLVLTYKDIDSTGEKLQQGAIKLFSEFEEVLIDKIKLLLSMNYREVYLVTDHGFVLTGLLETSDKITADIKGKKQVHERFIRTVEKQTSSDLIGVEKKYEDFNYVYFSKNHRPFVSKGVYGFSHGGMTPQEVIIPAFKISKAGASGGKLNISILNKKDLKEVTGELFGIKIKAESKAGDLFFTDRKVQIKVYSGNSLISTSQIFTLQSNEEKKTEFSFDGKQEVKVILEDALTKELLDETLVKRSNAREGLSDLF